MKKVRVVLMGHGHLGKWHAQKAMSLNQFAELVAIVEPLMAPPPLAAAESLPYLWLKSIEELKNVDYDAVLLATPTSMHADQVKYFQSLKKHVFCEKPIAEHLGQLSDFIPDSSLVLQIGHSERFHQFLELKSLWHDFVAKDALLHFTRVAPFKGRATDVDVIADLMIHDIDLMLAMTKEMPVVESVKAFKMRTDKWDFVEANFKFPVSNKKATITVGRNQTKEVREIQSTSSHGAMLIDLMNTTMHFSPAHADSWSLPYTKRDHLYMEQFDFYDCILNNKQPTVGWKDGLSALTLMDQVSKAIC